MLNVLPRHLRRFIPARAGDTCHGARARIDRRFIPARAGDALDTLDAGDLDRGSSPRVRGTLLAADRVRASASVHPRACGGHGHARGRRANTVHPRACGEHVAMALKRAYDRGSSPRVRGTPCTADRADGRIGSSPRVRGTLLRTACHAQSVGSSPRVRGTRFVEPDHLGASSVHPRACGEHVGAFSGPASMGGSSPRVRGTRDRALQRLQRRSVHPRACGERERCSRQASSDLRRFIPARAGNTPSGPWRPGSVSGSSPRVRGTP